MSDEPTETQAIDAGRRVAAFLEDPAVKGAFIALEKRYFADFKTATTTAEREALHARVRALDDLFVTVLGVKDSGSLAAHRRDQREANAKREQDQQRTRRGR